MRSQVTSEFMVIAGITILLILIILFMIKYYTNSTSKNLKIKYQQMRQLK